MSGYMTVGQTVIDLRDFWSTWHLVKISFSWRVFDGSK